MSIEDTPINRAENPEFKFTDRSKMLEESQAIVMILAPFLGEAIAKQTGEYLLGIAERLDESVQKLLAEASIQREFTYNGTLFKSKEGHGYAKASSGSKMMQDIKNKHLEYFFNTNGEHPANPAPEIYQEHLRKMIDFLFESYIDQTMGRLERFNTRGTIRILPEDLNFEEVLSNMPKEEAEEALRRAQDRTEEARKRRKAMEDPFFKRLEAELRKEDK